MPRHLRRLQVCAAHVLPPPHPAPAMVAAMAAEETAVEGAGLPSARRPDWRTEGLISAGLRLPEMKAAFERDGFVIVRGVVGEDERMNVQVALTGLVERAAVAAGAHAGL